MKAGRYLVELKGTAGTTGLKGAHADISTQSGSHIVASFDAETWERTSGRLLFQSVRLEASCNDFEFRVWVPATARVKIESLVISPA
jgi:hypothetical protein